MAEISIAAKSPSAKLNLSKDGACIVENCVTPEWIQRLDDSFPAVYTNLRNALEMPIVRQLSRSSAIRQLVIPALGEDCFAARAILFNKTADSNWKVSWHQDVVIAVKERVDVGGYGPWSIKDGVSHVRPPVAVLEKMLAVRLHLDDCGEDNGPLRVLPGTHTRGVLSDAEIVTMSKDEEFVCSVKRGDAILDAPLVLHASSPARISKGRRVIHIEFGSGALAPPLQWHESTG